MNTIEITRGQLSIEQGWLAQDTADRLLALLLATVPWEQRNVVVHGKTFPQPRLTAWFGTGAYSYSGTSFAPLPMTEELAWLQRKLEAQLGTTFNSVLLNRYVAGSFHGIGMHSDDEKELGRNPTIAMLTMGEERALHFEPKKWIDDTPRQVPTPHGSLLVMAGEIQKNWKHGLPKSKFTRDRVTLTFRNIG